jgi:hypothetical protein
MSAISLLRAQFLGFGGVLRGKPHTVFTCGEALWPELHVPDNDARGGTMRSTKAFLLGLGAALFIDRAVRRHRRDDGDDVLIDDATLEHRVLGDALPAAGVDPETVEVEVEDGVVSLQGVVDGSEQADALVQKVAEVPGVRDVAAMIRVSDRRAA